MASGNNQRNSLPKFGEWDVNNPAAGEGYTVIFNKARDQKNTNPNGSAGSTPAHGKIDQKDDSNLKKTPRTLLCCFFGK